MMNQIDSVPIDIPNEYFEILVGRERRQEGNYILITIEGKVDNAAGKSLLLAFNWPDIPNGVSQHMTVPILQTPQLCTDRYPDNRLDVKVELQQVNGETSLVETVTLDPAPSRGR